MVDCTCLENKSPFTRTVSSNLTSSAHTKRALLSAFFVRKKETAAYLPLKEKHLW